ncbi:MAG TPA: MBL fold metallo-hydrolase [Opitutaceae bacterium]
MNSSPRRCLFLLASFLLTVAPALAGRSDRTLDFYWVDSEGGGSTLIVTPEGESLLIDTGNPGGRDAGRIHAAAKLAGLERIDHVVITHFHRDHFGGAAELAQLIPIGTVHDKGIPEGDPDGRSPSTFPLQIKPYREIPAQRALLSPGMTLRLRGAAEASRPSVAVRVLAANQVLVPAPSGRAANPRAGEVPAKAVDTSDNANSVVLLLEFGGFRFFAGGDLTWNVEAKLVVPVDLIGEVDVYQVGHHGLDQSNHPSLVRTLAPTVSVMSNGPRKGAEAGILATLQTLPSLQAMYQVHRNVRVGPEGNAPAEFVANAEEACEGHLIKLSVAPDGQTYTVSIPSSGHQRTFTTRRRP